MFNGIRNIFTFTRICPYPTTNPNSSLRIEQVAIDILLTSSENISQDVMTVFKRLKPCHLIPYSFMNNFDLDVQLGLI